MSSIVVERGARTIVLGNRPRFGIAGAASITVNAKAFTIVGIAPRGFTGTMAIASPDLWFPLGVYDQVVTDIFKQQATGIDDRRSDGLAQSPARAFIPKGELSGEALAALLA